MAELLDRLVFIAGIGHILLALVSLVIPKLLNWHDELVSLSPLIRQLFWTYAGYILGIHLFFGVISLSCREALLSGNDLATAVCMFIGLYWTVRITLQFTYFDRSHTDKSILYKLGEIGLISLFVFFIVVFWWATWYNMGA